MPTSRYSIRRAFAIASIVLIAAVFGATSPDASTGGPPKAGAAQAGQTPPAAAASPADYAGEDACLSCHPTQSYKDTAHARTLNPRTPASTHGCESCHGAGKAHVDAGGDTSKIVNPGNLAPQASETCTACHDRARHAPWSDSQHTQPNARCTTCHSIHAAAGPKLLKARPR